MAVLRSPLHRALSSSLMVLSYDGRRSGRRYEVPLQYVRHGEGIAVWAGNAEAKTWWRNFTEPATVEVVLGGRTRQGKAHLVGDAATRRELLSAYLERYPATTPGGRPKFFGTRWTPTPAELGAAAAEAVFVAVDLE
jgi:deazaflavin-dependent oxidoreductase (nitroreductase family)